MSSGLRNQFFPSPTPASIITRPTTASPPQKKQKMSLTQTYYVAHTARAKLSKEAARADHDLRLLVGHANLLDGLILDLANAEREQESWFNQTVNSNTKAEEPKQVQWADTIPEELEAVEEEFYTEDSDSESESDDEEDMEFAQTIKLPQLAKVQPRIITSDVEMDDDEYDDNLALTRTSSHVPLSTPELLHEDSDSESEDDSMPPSPPQTELSLDAFSEAQRKAAIVTTSFYQDKSDSPASLSESEQASFFDEGFYLPQRRQQQTAIAAY